MAIFYWVYLLCFKTLPFTIFVLLLKLVLSSMALRKVFTNASPPPLLNVFFHNHLTIFLNKKTKKFRVLFTPLLISSSKGLEVFLEWILDFWRRLYITDTQQLWDASPSEAEAFYVHTWAMYKYNQRIINPPYMCHKILNSFKSMKFQFIIHIEAEHYHYLKLIWLKEKTDGGRRRKSKRI